MVYQSPAPPPSTYFFQKDIITGWWFGTFFIFPDIRNFIIPIDSHIFQSGRVQPSTRLPCKDIHSSTSSLSRYVPPPPGAWSVVFSTLKASQSNRWGSQPLGCGVESHGFFFPGSNASRRRVTAKRSDFAGVVR